MNRSIFPPNLLLCLSFILSLAAAGLAQEQSAPSRPVVEKSEKVFSFYPGGKIRVRAGAPGSVSVTGWERSSVRVEIERIYYYLTAEQAKTYGERHPVNVSWTHTTADISTGSPPRSAMLAEVNLAIYVPAEKTDLDVRLSRGDFSASAMNGWVEATLKEGNIAARSLRGYFSAVTERGDLEVEMSGARWAGPGFTAGTKMGTIHVRLPEGFSASLHLETRDGEIDVGYGGSAPEGGAAPFRIAGNKKARILAAILGEGGPPVRILTNAGRVRLSGPEPR